jgi:hypothetical protein
LIVTAAPAGTVIVLLSKARFWATRSITTGFPSGEEVGEGLAVGDGGEGVEADGLEVEVGVAVADGEVTGVDGGVVDTEGEDTVAGAQATTPLSIATIIRAAIINENTLQLMRRIFPP